MATWRKRETVEDRKTEPRSTVLSEADEAVVVARNQLAIMFAGRFDA